MINPVPRPPHALFRVHGVELEYMIVDRDSLDIRPISDRLLRIQPQAEPDDIERGPFTWSNELVRHVIEIKTTEPVAQLAGWDLPFHDEVRAINQRLSQWNACLLPGGMHPWMDPQRELELWPFGASEIYQAFDRVFNCHGHGWANLQSVHLNLPFANDQEFGRLHAAIRVVLPLLPALAASSPYCDGQAQPNLDQRLQVYRLNARRLASIVGRVIPEAAFSESEYRQQILEPMYREIAPFDTTSVLRNEFLNARGAIARFQRGSIEIRLLDISECPTVDLAVCAAVTSLVRALALERWSRLEQLQSVSTESLYLLLLNSIRDGELAICEDRVLLECLGWTDPVAPNLNRLWGHLLHRGRLMPEAASFAAALGRILDQGPLARRLRQRLGPQPSRKQLRETYRSLTDCLEKNQMFEP
jgi:gamma-glutamyl:cysteine ligase YbdK (ATP-grasp superfamily)